MACRFRSCLAVTCNKAGRAFGFELVRTDRQQTNTCAGICDLLRVFCGDCHHLNDCVTDPGTEFCCHIPVQNNKKLVTADAMPAKSSSLRCGASVLLFIPALSADSLYKRLVVGEVQVQKTSLKQARHLAFWSIITKRCLRPARLIRLGLYSSETVGWPHAINSCLRREDQIS